MKNIILNSKLLSFIVVHVSNKIIKRAEKKIYKLLQDQIEAAKTPQQEKTSSKHRIMSMDGSARSGPEKGCPTGLTQGLINPMSLPLLVIQ